MPRDYAIYDVFTDRRLAGNPLAVVFDAQGLDDVSMQAIAGEFNLSETVFVLPPENPAHAARLRIFTPARELPFAGHPTVGAAVALTDRTNGGAEGTRLVVLEERVGPVRCAIHAGHGVAYAEFDLPVLPEPVHVEVDRVLIAEALGLDERDIGFENHVPSVWEAGNAFVHVPVHGLEAAGRIDPDLGALHDHMPPVHGRTVGCFVYCRETVGHDCAFHARMFSANTKGEDPATGSAVASMAGLIAHFDGLAEGPNAWWIEQGIEMGRPSRIRLEVTGRGGRIAAARIGGHAVRVAQGSLML